VRLFGRLPASRAFFHEQPELFAHLLMCFFVTLLSGPNGRCSPRRCYVVEGARRFASYCSSLTPQELAVLAAFGVAPQQLFDELNSTGLRNWDGSAKPAWSAALSLVFQ